MAFQQIAGFDYPAFINDIQQYRHERGMTLAQFGAMLGYSTDVVRQIEKQRYGLSMQLFVRVCDCCGFDKRKYWSTTPEAPKPEPASLFDTVAFGRALRAWRKRKPLTQKGLGRMVNRHHTTISKIENGLTPEELTIKTIADLHRITGISPRQFWK